MKQKSRLQFTEEECADPTLKEPIEKSEKKADKVDMARSKIQKKQMKIKERIFDTETGKTKVRLHFEETNKVKPPSKLSHLTKQANGIAYIATK